MIVKTLLTPLHKFARRTRTQRVLLITGLCLAGSVFASASISATNLPANVQVAPAAELALYDWRAQPTLPADDAGALVDPALQSLTEEASKQAQTRYLAEKWRRPHKTVREYVNLAWEEAGKREGLDAELLIAIMQKESSLSPKVQSRQGAQGLMQVIRRWHRDKLKPSESLFDPKVNIRVAADILEEYLELADGSLHRALAKYSGNARGYANTILNESRKLARVADQAAAIVAMSQS